MSSEWPPARAIVAVEMHQADLLAFEPGDIAGRILDVEVDVVGRIVGPGRADDEFGLEIDRTRLVLGGRIDQRKGHEHHHGEAEKGVEQDVGERNECAVVVLVADWFHDVPTSPRAAN